MLANVVLIVGLLLPMSKSILALEKIMIILKHYCLTLAGGPLSKVILSSTIAAMWSCKPDPISPQALVNNQ